MWQLTTIFVLGVINLTSERFYPSIFPSSTVNQKQYTMCAKMAFTHQPGTAMECLSVSTYITIHLLQ